MSSADVVAPGTGAGSKSWFSSKKSAASSPAADKGAASAANAAAQARANGERGPERFVPVTRFALMDRLAAPNAWPPGEATEVRRLFRYLDYWRGQQYNAKILALEQTYEAFSPDTDNLLTRKFTEEERRGMQRRVVDQMASILTQANYEQIDPRDVNLIITSETHYGLDLSVDFGAFEECLIFYRGATNKRDTRRPWRRFFLKEEFDVPIYRRLFLLFKLKPMETRIREVMQDKKLDRKMAEKMVRKLRAMLPEQVNEDNIYMKLFKNIPRSDIEMVFPNTQVKFRPLDKLRLGVTATGGVGMGIVGAAGKIALVIANPVAAAGAAVGLGGIAARQFFNFMNQKQRYMVIMAQNLYFHSMADNRGVMIKLAARAAEEDVKEEMLLYSVLAKEQAKREDLPAIDAAIEQYIQSSFGVTVNFDLDDALYRLIEDGLVAEDADGTLTTLPPRQAAKHLDEKWDMFLDNLPDFHGPEGREFEGNPPAQSE